MSLTTRGDWVAYPDLEDVIDGCTTVFQRNFAAALAAVDARKSTPLNPNPPVDWVFGDKANLPQMPAMLITSHATQEESDEYDWRNQIYQLEIEAYYSGDDVQNLSRIMRRYGAAIDDTLRGNQSLGGVAKNVTNIKQQYWDSMSAKTGLFQVVRVTFDVAVITD